MMMTTIVKEEERAAMENLALTSRMNDIYLPFFMYDKMIEQLDTECYFSMEEAALTTYEQAIELAPRQAVLHYHKGQILEQMGRIREAQIAYEVARTLGYQC